MSISANAIWVDNSNLYSGNGLVSVLDRLKVGKIKFFMPAILRWNGNNFVGASSTTVNNIISVLRNGNYPDQKVLARTIMGSQPNITTPALRTQMVNSVKNYFSTSPGNQLDGLNDDIELGAGGETSTMVQNRVAYYNELGAALKSIGKICSVCLSVGNQNDQTLYGQTNIDYIVPMFYNGGWSSESAFRSVYDRDMSYARSPTIVGIRIDQPSLPQLFNWIDNANNAKTYPALAGYAIWNYDSNGLPPGRPMSSTEWTAWNNWKGKDPGPTPTPVLTTITIDNATIGIGATKQLVAVCKDQTNNTMTCPALTWNTSNSAIVTVNASGLVTGIAVGTANITSSGTGSGGVKTGTSTITVTSTPPPPTQKTYTIVSGTLERNGGRTIILTGGTITLKEQ